MTNKKYEIFAFERKRTLSDPTRDSAKSIENSVGTTSQSDAFIH